MESHQEFLNRVNSYQTPTLFDPRKCFTPSEGVGKKVARDGMFRSFFGDTVVFKIRQEEQQQIEHIAKSLYKSFGDCFAEQLDAKAYHVTLHDLVSENDLSQIAVQIFENELLIKDAFASLNPLQNSIKMKSVYLHNMVNTSIVLVLIPESKADYQELIRLKRILQMISPLNYPLTPHITLAYFNRLKIDQDKMKDLSRLATELYSESLHFSLHIDDLFYQKFINMNRYYDIFRIFDK